MSIDLNETWERLKFIWRTLSYAAALTLLGASSVSTNDQWTAILSRWAMMMLVVVLARIGWMACAQIVQEARRVLQEKQEAMDEVSQTSGDTL